MNWVSFFFVFFLLMAIFCAGAAPGSDIDQKLIRASADGNLQLVKALVAR